MGFGDWVYKGVTKVDRGYLDNSGVNMHSWGNVKSVHNDRSPHGDWGTAKTLGKAGMFVGSTAYTTATNTGVSTLAYTAATGGTIALGATGIGAIAVAGAYAAGSSIAAGFSIHKTLKHIRNLEKIQCQRHSGFCEGDGDQHNTIKSVVLPYIIAQKKRKLRRKKEEAVPVLGTMATGLETGVRSIYKRIAGKRSGDRHYMAEVLTVHLVSCTCDLAEDIVSELWSKEEMLAIRSMDSNDAGYWIYSKMASF